MGSWLVVDQIDHVEVCVPDVGEAAAWYERTLGLAPVTGLSWTVPLMISSDGGSTKVALFEGEAQVDDRGWKRVAFRVPGAAFLRFLESAGAGELRGGDGTPLASLDAVDHASAWSAYFHDPWGNRLELTTYDYEEVAEALEERAK